jgi:hypothetical protein
MKPSSYPTPSPSTSAPSFSRTPTPTVPTYEPTTHMPTVYDFKTMNYNGYIAVCVLVPYAVIGYTCICVVRLLGSRRCSKNYIIDLEMTGHVDHTDHTDHTDTDTDVEINEEISKV